MLFWHHCSCCLPCFQEDELLCWQRCLSALQTGRLLQHLPICLGAELLLPKLKIKLPKHAGHMSLHPNICWAGGTTLYIIIQCGAGSPWFTRNTCKIFQKTINLLRSLFDAWRCKKVGKLAASAPLATALHMLQMAMNMEIDGSIFGDLNIEHHRTISPW